MAAPAEDLRERIERAKRAHPLLPTVLAEGIELRRSGRGRWQGRCPFHDDRHPSFTVYEEEDRFKCFGGACGERGDIFDWYRLRRGLDLLAALDFLDGAPPPPARDPGADRAPGDDDAADPCWEALGYEEQVVMNCAGAWYHRRLLAAPAARAYLARRGIPLDVIASQWLGYSDGTGLYEALGGERQRAIACALGLFTLAPQFRGHVGRDHARIPRGAWREALAGRLVIPELRGDQPVWFAGRLLEGDPAAGTPGSDWQPPKYRNLRGSRPILGYEHVAGRREVFLVEGPFDYLTALAWGLAACCTCGTNYRLDRLGFLASAETVFGLFDGDEAGRTAIWRFAPILGAALRPLGLPDGLDLNALARLPDGRERFEALLAAGRRGQFLRPPDEVRPGPD